MLIEFDTRKPITAKAARPRSRRERRASVYSPRMARFMQPDPIGYGDGLNLYGYVSGDPINLSDPSGLTPVSERCHLPGEEPCEGGKGEEMVVNAILGPSFAALRFSGGSGSGFGGYGGGGGSQPPGLVPTDEEQRQECRSNPNFSIPRSDPGIARAIQDAIGRTRSTGLEHGFWVLFNISNFNIYAGPIYNSEQRNSISLAEGYPTVRDIIGGAIPSRLFVFVHDSGRGIIWPDVGALRAMNAIGMVVNLDGEAFCHDPS